MKFLLTSGGISNDSIRNALVDLLGKPIAKCNALYIPTVFHANPNGPADRPAAPRRVQHLPVRSGVGIVGRAGAHRAAKSQEEASAPAVPGDGRPGRWKAVIPCICATGCSNQDWPTSCRSFHARWSM